MYRYYIICSYPCISPYLLYTYIDLLTTSALIYYRTGCQFLGHLGLVLPSVGVLADLAVHLDLCSEDGLVEVLSILVVVRGNRGVLVAVHDSRGDLVVVLVAFLFFLDLNRLDSFSANRRNSMAILL